MPMHRRGASAERASRRRSARVRWGTGVAAAALMATMGGAGLIGQPVASASPSAHQASTVAKGAKVASGAFPSYALLIGDYFTWILPLDNQVGYEAWDINIERGMWLPLY